MPDGTRAAVEAGMRKFGPPQRTVRWTLVAFFVVAGILVVAGLLALAAGALIDAA